MGVIDGPNQEYLAQLWSTQLNWSHVGLAEDLFEAGRSSMQMIEMLISVSRKSGKEIDLA